MTCRSNKHPGIAVTIESCEYWQGGYECQLCQHMAISLTTSLELGAARAQLDLARALAAEVRKLLNGERNDVQEALREFEGALLGRTGPARHAAEQAPESPANQGPATTETDPAKG